MYFIIAYDSPSSRRRRKFLNILKDFLTHVQESVFEGHLEPPLFKVLFEKITGLASSKEDSLRIYQMPKSCWEKTTVIGFPALTKVRPIVVVSK